MFYNMPMYEKVIIKPQWCSHFGAPIMGINIKGLRIDNRRQSVICGILLFSLLIGSTLANYTLNE